VTLSHRNLACAKTSRDNYRVQTSINRVMYMCVGSNSHNISASLTSFSVRRRMHRYRVQGIGRSDSFRGKTVESGYLTNYSCCSTVDSDDHVASPLEDKLVKSFLGK
jgi:hypothetical protein